MSEQIIVNTIFDHFNIHEEYDTNVMFKCFAENDGKWFGYFYQPYNYNGLSQNVL